MLRNILKLDIAQHGTFKKNEINAFMLDGWQSTEVSKQTFQLGTFDDGIMDPSVQ